MKKLALFDLDGTLFDTKEVNYFAYKYALNKVGYEIDYDYFINYCNGRHYTDFLPQIVSDKKIIEEIHKLKKESYYLYLEHARINENLFNLIRSIKNTYNVAIVTTASYKNTCDILNKFKVFDLFDDVITPNDYEKTKPNPEPFLVAISRFGVKIEDVIIFEDSDVGLQSAMTTGATVFKVCNF